VGLLDIIAVRFSLPAIVLGMVAPRLLGRLNRRL
jgi:hypothetical protein